MCNRNRLTIVSPHVPQGLKAILHALLISGTLPTLNLAANRKVKYNGWRYLSGFMRRAQALRYLDLSENVMNRPALEAIVGSLVKSQETLLKLAAEAETSKRAGAARKVEEKGAEGEADGEASMRDIEQDDPDFDEDGLPLQPEAPLLRNVADGDEPPSSSVISLRLENCGLRSSTTLESLANAVRFSTLKHISLRRNRIAAASCSQLATILKDYPDSHGAVAERATSIISAAPTSSDQEAHTSPANGPDGFRSPSPALPEGPQVFSSPGGGVTSRRMPFAASQNGAASAANVSLSQAKAARQLLSEITRMGSLLTLDLKSNDIRGGVTQLAHALKKNRTLKVLNLSDNNVDSAGLMAIADALKYNPVLETLDLSHNPCSGPELGGINALRIAFTLNFNLKRLFLNDTDLTSEGAIALAEYLPEVKSLIHLDLTENFDVDIAGVMAFSVAVKMNRSLRCLDINIPPNNREFARLSQEILQSCVRNTEMAQQRAARKGLKHPIAAPIFKSAVAKAAKKEENERERAIAAAQNAAKAEKQDIEELVKSAAQCRDAMISLEDSEKTRRQEDAGASTPGDAPEEVEDLIGQSAKVKARLIRAVEGMEDGRLLGESQLTHRIVVSC